MQDKQSLIQDIRSGKIDINNQELFFSILIKGLMSKGCRFINSGLSKVATDWCILFSS